MAKTILLADDSVTIQKVVELTFMDEDYSVIAVSDGAAALEQLPEVAPDLLIADVHMPGADGYEVCRRTKESHPSIPVLLLVGTFEQFDEARAEAAGADGHLKKPFDSQELLSQVDALISRSAPSAGPPAEGVPPADGVPTAEIPLADFAPPPPADDVFLSHDSARTDGPLPEIADLEPPPFDEAAAGVEDAGELFELEEEGAAEDLEPPPLEGEPLPLPEAAAAAPVELPPQPIAEAAPAEAPAATEAAEAPAPAAANGALSDADVERIARRVAETVGEKMLREVAWEVIPDLAEVIIKERIRELESQVE